MVLILFVLDSIPILQPIIQLPDLVVKVRLQFSGRTTSATEITLGGLVSTSTTIPTFYTADVFSMLAQHTKTMLGTSSGDKMAAVTLITQLVCGAQPQPLHQSLL
jgi:hypothetical protein